MGGSSSKAGATAARAARAMPKSVFPGKHPNPAPTAAAEASQIPGDDELLSKFKPTKVVEMSQRDAQAAAKKMYDQQVPEMAPDILAQAMAMGPAEKAELKHQKLVPDSSELAVSKTPRPLPKNRRRASAVSSEVDAKKGFLTQTQLQALLERRGESPAEGLTGTLVDEFRISEDSAAVLLRYYRAPDLRMSGGVMTARWRWPIDDEKFKTSSSPSSS